MGRLRVWPLVVMRKTLPDKSKDSCFWDLDKDDDVREGFRSSGVRKGAVMREEDREAVGWGSSRNTEKVGEGRFAAIVSNVWQSWMSDYTVCRSRVRHEDPKKRRR